MLKRSNLRPHVIPFINFLRNATVTSLQGHQPQILRPVLQDSVVTHELPGNMESPWTRRPVVPS